MDLISKKNWLRYIKGNISLQYETSLYSCLLQAWCARFSASFSFNNFTGNILMFTSQVIHKVCADSAFNIYTTFLYPTCAPIFRCFIVIVIVTIYICTNSWDFRPLIYLNIFPRQLHRTKRVIHTPRAEALELLPDFGP